MNDSHRPTEIAPLPECYPSRSYCPERFAQGKCADCHAPLSIYNPHTVCEMCRQRRRRRALPRNSPLRVEQYLTEYLLKLRQREPLTP
jgi:hypothetical protein